MRRKKKSYLGFFCKSTFKDFLDVQTRIHDMCRIKRKSIDSNSIVWPAVMKSLTFYSSIKKRAFVCLISIKVTVKGERYIKENKLMWETIRSLLISNFHTREITSLRLDMMYYPSIKKRASVFLINIFEFRISIPKKLHPTVRHDVGTEFKLFKTPFLKFPYPIKSNKSDAQEKKSHILVTSASQPFLYFILLSTEAHYVDSSCSAIVMF